MNGIGMTERAPSAPLEHTVIMKNPLFVFGAHMAIPHTTLEPPVDQIVMNVRLPRSLGVFVSFHQYHIQPKQL